MAAIKLLKTRIGPGFTAPRGSRLIVKSRLCQRGDGNVEKLIIKIVKKFIF